MTLGGARLHVGIGAPSRRARRAPISALAGAAHLRWRALLARRGTRRHAPAAAPCVLYGAECAAASARRASSGAYCTWPGADAGRRASGRHSARRAAGGPSAAPAEPQRRRAELRFTRKLYGRLLVLAAVWRLSTDASRMRRPKAEPFLRHESALLESNRLRSDQMKVCRATRVCCCLGWLSRLVVSALIIAISLPLRAARPNPNASQSRV